MSIPVPGAFGRLVGDPDLRHTSAGQPVVRFMMATSPARRRRTSSNADVESVWMCTAWSELAVNIAASLRRGQRVFVRGRLVERVWTDRSGVVQRRVELTVDDCGPSLRSAQARLRETARVEDSSDEGPGPWGM